MARIIISEFMDREAVAALTARHDVVYDASLVDARDALVAAVHDADALIVRNRTQVDAALLAAAPALTVVGRLGVGLDNIDVAAAKARGIKVIPATGANAQAVAEYVMTTALMLRRGAYLATAAVAAGHWPRAKLSEGRELGVACMGVVGFGGIGQLTARFAQVLGMRVIAHDTMIAASDPRYAEGGVVPVLLEQLFADADVVTLHVPLSKATRNLVDAKRLSTMKKDAVLINTARGGVVDEAALAAALRAGTLAGAALDVFADEPLPVGSPLADAPNLILTPHIAGVTAESNVRVSSMIAERVAAVLASACDTQG